MPSLSAFFYNQWFANIPEPTASFAGKTVVITGGSGVLGKESAKWFVRLGAPKVILAVRNLDKANKAKKEIEADTRCQSDVVECWDLDIESPTSIKSFVDKASTLDRVDVVVNNAGCVTKYRINEAYGTEANLAVNTIGTLFFAIQMIPKLKATAAKFDTTPVMTTITSALYDVAKWPTIKTGEDVLSVYRDPNTFDAQAQYNISKLLVTMGVIKMAQLVDPLGSSAAHPIVINQMDPLFLKTDLHGENAGLQKITFGAFSSMVAREPEVGGRLVATAASSGRDTHGKYMKRVWEDYAPIAEDVEKTKHFWDAFCNKAEEVQPGLIENLKV